MTEKQFITLWTNKISDAGIKLFPGEFLNNFDHEIIKLSGKALVIGEEFFGSFEILTIDGTPVLHTDSHTKAKFIIYANRLKPVNLKLPKDEKDIKKAVSSYENYLDEIIKLIDIDYKKNFPGEKNSSSIVNEIFRVLNLIRY